MPRGAKNRTTKTRTCTECGIRKGSFFLYGKNKNKEKFTNDNKEEKGLTMKYCPTCKKITQDKIKDEKHSS